MLTEIAFKAKRHWGYPDPWIEEWSDELTIRPEFISEHETYAAIRDDRIAGFYAIVSKHRLHLQHLWVQPDLMGRGIGRLLFLHALERMKIKGFRELEIESDPNAEGFYRRMGARRIGTIVSQVQHQRRELPLMIYEIGP